MEAKPKAFNIKLTEAERAKLEQHRAKLGLRSHAEVIRLWISGPPEPLIVTYEQGMAMLERGELAPHLVSDATPRFEAAKALVKLIAENPRIADLPIGPAKAKPGSRLKGKK